MYSGLSMDKRGLCTITKQVIERIHADVVKVLAQKDVANVLESLGAEAIGNTPAEFSRVIQTGIPKWIKLVKSMRAPGGR